MWAGVVDGGGWGGATEVERVAEAGDSDGGDGRMRWRRGWGWEGGIEKPRRLRKRRRGLEAEKEERRGGGGGGDGGGGGAE
ncbi:hypothetical protein CYMTET_34112 [Cymbomonas tetramitiformis]|uniref:Uncharacterized protein n=1 Tax=Cymbomonas tetramitiformis TaxID=36881 RepID=A0AAE0FBQ4_9CHLO|nr:hypothetical protein CYMTET_34112 [Cymbomonas tetramitiformis]